MHKYAVLIFLLVQTRAFSQAPTPQSMQAAINSYGDNYPQEKVYIQFDKPAYSAGETIWFKAYLVNGLEISALSKTFYIDFTDADGNILMHGVYPVVVACAAGSFQVDSAYKGGSIHVRAYTKWMLNFDSAFLYNSNLRIITKNPAGTTKVAQPAVVASLQFFPEGGDCVDGIKTRVAFKAGYNNGLPADINGVVTDSKGSIVDSIKCLHDGMGFFHLEGKAGETYTAIWMDSSLVTCQTPLPAAKPFGATIQVNPGRLRTGFFIKRQENAPGEMKKMYVVATMQQQVVYIASVNLEESPFTSGNIPSAQFPSGIMQVTLFDANWKAVAERICFINDNDYQFQPEVHFDTLATAKRGKNVLVITVPDSIESNLSVSVTDAGIGVGSSDDIISHLLVTGDLKGRVYHPGYYFSNNSDSVAGHLDLVMLTNGWRRFKWDDITAGNAPALKYPRDTSYLGFYGKVVGATPKQIKDAPVILTTISPVGRDSSRQYFTLPLSSDGSFSMPEYTFYDTLKVFYKFPSKAGYKLNNLNQVNFTSGGLPSPRHVLPGKNNAPYIFADTTGDYYNGALALEQARLQQLLKTTTLAAVTVKGYTKSKMQLMDEKYAGGMFTGGNSTQFDITADPSASISRDVLTYLMGRVAGLRIIKTPTTIILRWRGGPVSLYIDEVKTDESGASALNISDVAYIKTFPPDFFGNVGAMGGAISIYTRRGDEIQDNDTTRMKFQLVAGYTQAKEFYSPNYDTANNVYQKEDVRSTLYWNPWIVTGGGNHVIKLPFYNNDVTKSFRVVIEGVSNDGRLARVEKLVK